ncbi:hypothetical protein HDU97_004364, partial [Phlyctochytrium planicorne]
MTDIEKDPQFVTEAEMELAMERKHKHEETGDVDPESGEYLDEIYDIVDAVVPRTDDPTLPVLTFRVIILGGFFCVALCCANTLFTFIGVLLSYPLGKLMEKVLPRGILNPGPFNHKEHALIYICCNSGANTSYALYNIIGQNTTINTQIFGYGLAGLCRRYLVRPAAMLWPSNLSIVAMLNTLHEKPNPDDQYTMSRYKFFWLVTLASALWQIFPGYIAPVPFPSSATLVVCGSWSGSSPPSSGSTTPSVTTSTLVSTRVPTLPVSSLSAVPSTPLLSSTLTDPVSPPVLSSSSLTLSFLDEEFYNENKPIYISTYFAMEYLSSFMVFIAAIVHVGLWYGKDIWTRFRTALKDLDSSDVHAKLMDFYPEVPDWWYIWGGFDLPWWGVILGLALAVVSILPIGIIQAISGQAIGLNV